MFSELTIKLIVNRKKREVMLIHPGLREGLERVHYSQIDLIEHSDGSVTVLWSNKSLIEWQVYTIDPNGVVKDFDWPKLGNFNFKISKKEAETLIKQVKNIC